MLLVAYQIEWACSFLITLIEPAGSNRQLMVRPTSRLLKNGFILVIKKMVAFSTIAAEVLI